MDEANQAMTSDEAFQAWIDAVEAEHEARRPEVEESNRRWLAERITERVQEGKPVSAEERAWWMEQPEGGAERRPITIEDIDEAMRRTTR